MRDPRRGTLWLVEEFGHGGIGRYTVDVSNLVGDAAPTVVASTDSGPVTGLHGRAVVWFPRGSDSALAKARAAVVGLIRAARAVRRGDVAWIPLGVRPAYELALLLALRLGGATVVVTVHNLGPHGSRRASRLVRLTARRADLAVIHTDALAVWAHDAGVRAVRLPFVPPDVRHEWGTSEGADALRAGLGVAEGHLVVGLLGYLYPYKGPDLLLQALARARAAEPDLPVHVLMAGRPSDEVDLQELRARLGLQGASTLRLGWLEEAEISDLLRVIDVIALPYRRIDNSGMGAMARSWGLPAVASDLPLLRDLYDEAALFSPPGDVGGLAASLRALPGAFAALRGAAQHLPETDLSAAYRAFAASLRPWDR